MGPNRGKWGLTGANKAKQSQMWSHGGKTGPNIGNPGKIV